MTANMTNRDAKGKFVKAKPVPQKFKKGDVVRVSRCQPGYEFFKVGDIGTVVRPYDTLTTIDFKKTGIHPANKSVYKDGVWSVGKSEGESAVELAPAELQPAPAPCPFKVGDWVYHLTCKPEERGTVEQVFTEAVATRWEGGTVSTDEFEAIRKVENTAAKPCRVDVDLLIYERDGLLDEVSRLKTEAKERANAYSQNMQAVKDELTAANDKRDELREKLRDYTVGFDQARFRATEAEAKLADIAAINRVAEIVNALPEGSEDWHFQVLVADVLKGGVAA